MTRRNRVLPTGEIAAIPARGTFMGNRGILHDAEGRLGPALWRHKAWICCRLAFRGRRRALMAPGRYTELFFHDEAVALAAGHRPCGECRREDLERFRDAWAIALGVRAASKEIDVALHAARAHRGGRCLRRHEAEAADLPDGTFILRDGVAALLIGSTARRFGADGYGAASPRPTGTVTVLTPAPIVEVLRAGYRPALALG